MKFRPEHLLDRCLHQLDSGGDVEEVLGAYPELADELRPALAASEWMRAFAPPPRRRLEQKGRFVAAVAERRRLVERVDGLVVEIKAGVSPEEIGARLDASLQPVIAAAHRMYATDVPLPAPDRLADGRVRLMAMAAERQKALRPARASAARTVHHGMLQGLLPRPTMVRRLFTSAAAISLALTLAFAGVLRVQSVAASSLPGQVFYGVKRLGENARMMFAFDPARRANLEAVFAQRRMQELMRMDAEGRSVPLDFVEEWLVDNAGMSRAITELTRDQRAALSRALVAAAEDEAARTRLERNGVAPAVLDTLLTPEAGTPEQPTIDDGSIGLYRGPSLRPQPLPEDESSRSKPAAAEKQDPVSSAAVPSTATKAAAPAGFVESIQASSEQGSDGQGGGSNAGNGQGSGSSNAGSPPAPGGGVVTEPVPDEPTASDPTEEPPPFVEPLDPGPQAPPEDPSGIATP